MTIVIAQIAAAAAPRSNADPVPPVIDPMANAPATAAASG